MHAGNVTADIQSQDDKSGTVGSRTRECFYRARSSFRKVGEVKSSKRKRDREWYAKLPFWRRAERAICQQLRTRDVECTLVSMELKPWDIETKAGLHIECKASNLLKIRKRTKAA